MKNKWWKNAVIYQIYPKSFKDSNNDGIGDINGIRSKLPYLKELGIDAIWISPIYKSPQIDNGYDISDYYSIDPMFGSIDEMKHLIKEAHNLNIKIIMDFVANHTSEEAFWFRESCKSKDNYYSDFYIWKDPKDNGEAPNNWGSNFGGSAWEWNEQRQQYYLHYYAKEQPDLNWENPNVREEIYKMMTFWHELGIDGWRMDVITSISKNLKFPDNENPLTTENQQNGPRMHEFIHEINQKVLKPLNMMSVGEAPAAKSSDAFLLVDPKREELDMIFTFEHMHIDREKNNINGRWAIKKPDIVQLKQIMSSWQNNLSQKGWNALYFENHDRARVISRWGNDKKYRYECATAFATILHGMQGTPYIYQGEEIGMTNPEYSLDEYKDIELKGNYEHYVQERKSISKSNFLDAVHKVSRDNARTPMQWSEDKFSGFSDTEPWFKINPNYKQINVEADRRSDKSIFYYYKSLIDIRHNNNILRDGSFKLLLPEHPFIFAYKRYYHGETWYIVANLSENKQDFNNILPSKYVKLIHNYKSEIDIKTLKPYESFIIKESN
ncbi:glycoside hydrolase family 13 protein [Lactococcus lactis]|uniref:glycoside hydrolase family 13 protein n=1 Tax=Lactococcus lactis TaxID=1358 RepID=UPI00210B59D5|nr:alpha-glucosidase [Lactococcus lactis]MCQ4996535.1 alpha-glucosidase [Lactococcus lactis]